MYIVLDGVFGVYVNSFSDFPARVAGIEGGSFFGEMSVIDGWTRSATVIAETDSDVCVIEKDNFKELLEKVPTIAETLLDTLRQRAINTAQTVKESGKEAPDFPPHLHKAQFTDVKKGMVFLTMLARQIRKMNEILAAPAIMEKPHSLSAKSESILKLLPDGHVKYNINENRDVRSFLELKKVICPYCAHKFTAAVPLFSALKPDRINRDGRVHYKDFDILKYTNIVCPDCYYTDTYREYSNLRKTDNEYDGSRFNNKESFTGYSNEYSHTLDEAVLSYYLNIKCLIKGMEHGGFNPLRFANAWMRLYWIYSDQSSTDLAADAARQAYSFYTLYFDENKAVIAAKDRAQISTILEELSAFVA
jgi:uncharacterized protein (DUF2225 family)